MMFQLEKYHGTKSRYTCPNCRRRQIFARYINDRGEYVDDTVGRCNRDSKCGYHLTPKMFHDASPQRIRRGIRAFGKMRRPPSKQPFVRETPKQADYIDFDVLLKTQTNFDRNSFVCFLFDLFAEDAAVVQQTAINYFIGTTKDGKTIFWQIDGRRRIRTGKIIAYDRKTGKRRKDVMPTWTHAELKRAGLLRQDFNLAQCFFGEHLLIGKPHATAAIVEAEKTAVIASMCFPEFVWLACGSKQNLKPEKLKRLGNRRILLYPDADGYELWRETARNACRFGLTVYVSSLIENHATDEQRVNGYDLADYLIKEQRQINEYNSFVDSYNSSLHSVLQDERLMEQFNRLYDAKFAELMQFDEESITGEIRDIVRSITDL